MRRATRALAVIAGLLAASATSRSPQDAPPLADVLKSAGTYVAKYEKQFSAVVAEERYSQAIRDASSIAIDARYLRSETAAINLGGGDWVGFRDVFEVDGRPVRDRDERLTRLFLQQTPDMLAQARRIADEGARFNIGNITRTINTPTLALAFLRQENQARSSFKTDGIKTVNRTRAALLVFEERAMPRMIVTEDDAPAKGRFWIDPGSGRVVRSELTVNSGGASARVTVSYAQQPKMDLWVPVTMDEEYRWTTERKTIGVPGASGGTMSTFESHQLPSSGTIEGHATYTNFRQFKVEANTIIRQP